VKLRILVSVLFTVVSFCAGAQEVVEHDESKFGGGDACIDSQLEPDLNALVAPIQSAEDIGFHMDQAKRRGSPLLNLSEKSRERFLESLTFNEKGLTGFRYDDLLHELSATQIYQVLALIGQQHSMEYFTSARVDSDLDRAIISGLTENVMSSINQKHNCPANIPKHRCASPSNCVNATRNICMSTC
jgi:hypothetical protein